MIGAIRLVNPDRGTVWGSFTDRLSVATTDGETWEVHAVEGGTDFYPGRTFSRREIEAWADADPLSPAELSVAEGVPAEDDLGRVPARSADPARWRWYAIGARGEARLGRAAKPTRAALIAGCREAISADRQEAIPLVDRFELWGCDLETGEPLALLLTGVTEAHARGDFSPRWRFCSTIDHGQATPTRAFEDRLNERICPIVDTGRVRFRSRLFERIDPRTVRELPLPGRPAQDAGPRELPQALLAGPWAAEHGSLRDAWEAENAAQPTA